MRSKHLTFLLILLLLIPQPTAARTDNLSALSTAQDPRLQFSITGASPGPEPRFLGETWALRTKFEPALLKELLAASDDEVLRGIVLMKEQPNVEQMGLAGMDRLSRRKTVIHQLQSLADRSQGRVRAILEQRIAAYKPLWIVNGIAFEGKREIFWVLAAHPDVTLIKKDHVRYLPDAERSPEQSRQTTAQPGGVQWNVQRVQADRVWQALGITGEGIVVANLDSGVDWEHPDLMTRYRGYTGKPFPVHDGNWYCATDEGYTYPGDGLGHGTHTMGTMVGQNGIGVAPGAQWIAAKIFNNQGQAYDSWIHDGFQWLLAPNGDPALAPDVVNNSWGSMVSSNQEFLPDVQALRAAGIFPAFAAGNHGPNGETTDSPGSFRESFAVGATDDEDVLARFSSRGPSPWGEIKPEVSAPGVDVLSTLPGGAWGSKNGTSMATPHVAGIVALMRQANPTLTVDQMEAILIETALPLGDEHPNNDYGWGLVNAYAAVTRAGSFGRLAGQVTDVSTAVAIADATVRAISHGSMATTTTTTDTSGEYNVGLSADYYDVTVSAFGYQTHVDYSVQVITGTTTTLNVALTALPTGVLQGVIRETGTNAPLQAAIYVPGAPATTTSVAGSGAYALTLPEGTHIVRVECAAHRFVTATVIVTDGMTTYRDFTLEPAPTILLVDSGAWYNDSQRSFYEAALEGLRYLYDRHVIANVDVSPTDVPKATDLLPYDLVIWSAPQDAPGYVGATNAITSYLSSGGRLLLSGQDVAFWDGGGNGWFHYPYLEDYFKARYVQDDAASRVLAGQGSLFAGLTITIAGEGGADNQIYPDVITSADEDFATSAWTYQADGEDGSGGQTVGPCLPYRAVYLSFGLEGINDDADRRQVLARSIDWLTAPPQSAGIELNAGEMPQIEQPGGWITHALRLRNMGEVNTDTYTLALSGEVWPTVFLNPSSIALGACQSTTLHISVSVPADTGWHVFDTPVLTARSTLSSSLIATASLTSKTPAPVLLVDGARFYHVEEQYQDALERAGIPYDYHRIKGVWPLNIPTTDTLAMYPMIVWYTAYDWYRPLSDQEEALLIAYLDGGGRLFLSSQDYLYYSNGKPLAREYLGVFDYVEDLSVTQAWGEPMHPIGWGIGPYTLTYTYNNWSDALIPTVDARVAFRGQHERPAGLTRPSDGWRTSFVAFSFETLDADAAMTVMERTVGWLSWLGLSTWEADRRTVADSDEVTMTCVLRNDGWDDITLAHFTTTLPAELSFIAGPTPGGAVYHPLTRTVTWEGSIAQNEAVTISFRARVTDSLSASTYITFPARIGYDEHDVSFERPYVLRVNAPDLSSPALVVEPASSWPWQVLSYTLTIRNAGVQSAVATVTATAPAHAAFTGTLDSGGIGSGVLVSQTLAWTGAVASGDQVALRYRLALDGAGDYWLIHCARVGDQYGERWFVEARTEVQFVKAYLPLVLK